MFRVGDPVMASTLGKPVREAAVVEVDPSDGSRFRVAFKDKRKKGGWRDKSELSALLLQQQQRGPPNDDEAPPAVDPPAAPTAAPTAGDAAGATAAAAGLPSPLACAFSHLIGKLETTAPSSVAFALPLDISRLDDGGDVAEFCGGGSAGEGHDSGSVDGSTGGTTGGITGGGEGARVDGPTGRRDKGGIRDLQPPPNGPSAVDAVSRPAPNNKVRKTTAKKTAGTKSKQQQQTKRPAAKAG